LALLLNNCSLYGTPSRLTSLIWRASAPRGYTNAHADATLRIQFASVVLAA
jgi:hypothetical protein